MIKKEYEAIAAQIIYYVLKSLDRDKLFAEIDSTDVNNPLTTATQKTEAKNLYDKLIRLQFTDSIGEFNTITQRAKTSVYFSQEGRANLELSISGKSTRIAYTGMAKGETDAYRKIRYEDNKKVEANQPVDYQDFFTFMDTVFPKGSSVTSVTNSIVVNRNNYDPSGGAKK